MNNCPCGNSLEYKNCCEVAHKDISKVKTAHQLMRSRYTAFTKAKGDYLMQSHHLTTRPLSEKKDIENWAKAVEWSRLEIIDFTKGQLNDTKGTVEFKAYFYEDNKLQCIHENSAFVKENGIWMYLGIV